jgi:signal transduction histidine kinase
MGRKGLLVAGAALFTVLVLASGLYAWIEMQSRVLGAAEAEGKALLRAVAAGIQASLEGGGAVEDALADRLLRLAPLLEEKMAASPGRERRALREFVDAQALRGALLLDDDFRVRAAAGPRRPAPERPGGPLSASRLDQLENAALALRAKEAGLADAGSVVLGFGENPLRPRTEFLVGARAMSIGGFVLLRLDAQSLESFREESGVRWMLREAASAAAITYLDLRAADGTVLAADDPARVGRPVEPTGGSAAWREDGHGRRVLDVALPAPWKGPPEGALHVGLDAAPVEAVLDRARLGLGVSTLLVLLAGHGALWMIVRRERRLRRREAILRRRLEARERFASLGRLAAGVAHEIRSPLNALSMAAQRLRREAAPSAGPERERFEELTAALRGGVGRLDATVEEFLALGRERTPPEITALDPGSIVRQVVETEGPGTDIRPPETRCLVLADPALLAKALANLVRNAWQAAPEGPVSIAWRRVGDSVRLDVDDGGPGLPEAERETVFEPFRTGRSGGTGLGLAIARDAVESLGGTILAGASSGGARFTITLPAGGES